MLDAFGVSKRVVLGRDLSPEAHTGAAQDTESYKKSRMGRLAAEEAKYEKMPAEDRRLRRGVKWDEHKKQSQDFDRWMKEMEAHGSDPVRAEQMRYAAKHNLDYPLKSPKRKMKTMEKDAFGVKREPSAVSKGLPRAVASGEVKGGYAGFRRLARDNGREAAKNIARSRAAKYPDSKKSYSRWAEQDIARGQGDRAAAENMLGRRANRNVSKGQLHEVNKAWNSILKPNMGVGPTMTPKQMKQARKAAQQVNAIKPKKAQKIMNAAAKEPEGTQVAPGVREYKPAPVEPKPAKQKKKTFFERNRTGLMWGGGGAGAGLLAGYAASGRN